MKKIVLVFAFLSTFSFQINAQEELFPVSRLLWGNSKTHFVTEDKVFIGAGGAIVICEIISADSIEVLSDFYLPSTVNDIYVRDNILFALDYREGLLIYNISDIYNPNLISTLNFGSFCYDFLYDSTYIYVALGNSGIKKVNVTNISIPFVENESSVRAFTINKFQSCLYCFAGNSDIVCDSISIVSSEDLLQGGTIHTEEYFSFIEGIYFNNHKGFLIENFAGPLGQESSAGILYVLELSNPFNPQRLGHITVTEDFLHKVVCLGDTVLTFGYGKLIVVNASNSFFPAIITQSTNALMNSGSFGYASLNYPQLYISYDYLAGFLIVDIENLMNPSKGYYLNTNNVTEVVWLKDSLLFAGGNGIYMADVSDIHDPVLKKHYTENVGAVRDIKTNDSLLFVASNTFKIFKIHGKDSLSFLSELDYGSQSSQVAIDDTFAAIGGRYWGMHLINISNPSNPLYIRSVPVPFYIKHMAYQNNKLIVSEYQHNTPVIYDVSDPNNPLLIYEGNYSTTAFCISESDTVLFVGDWDSYSLVVLNIKDLDNVYEISRKPVMGYPTRIEDIFVIDNLLFLTFFNQNAYDGNLKIYDITNLNNIVELGYAFLPEWAISVCANKNITVVTDYYDGLYIYDIINFIPVELISFTSNVISDNVHLSWVTASETNNMGFEILRCAQNDYAWKKIGFIEGKGTTAETQSYSFIDPSLSPGYYSYRLKQMDFDGTFEYSNIIEVEIGAPRKFSLKQNCPNPFNPSTTIQYAISNRQFVTLKVYDILGKEIATLVNGEKSAGSYEIGFNASHLASGIYYYQLRAGDYVETKKMILLK